MNGHYSMLVDRSSQGFSVFLTAVRRYREHSRLNMTKCGGNRKRDFQDEWTVEGRTVRSRDVLELLLKKIKEKELTVFCQSGM